MGVWRVFLQINLEINFNLLIFYFILFFRLEALEYMFNELRGHVVNLEFSIFMHHIIDL